jgi:hypothetical protein
MHRDSRVGPCAIADLELDQIDGKVAHLRRYHLDSTIMELIYRG